jgi:pimeloyl-ACP methyl ester carboxylesterase
VNNIPKLTGQYLRVGQHPIYHYSVGEGTPVVLLHGVRADVLRIETVVQVLATRFKVYAPDLPGFGKSPPLPGYHSLVRYAEIIKEYIDHLKLKDFYFVGISMGGIIAIHTLKSNDLSVKKAVLFGTPCHHSVYLLPPYKISLLKLFFKTLYYSKVGLWGLQKLIDSDSIMIPLVRRGQPPQYRGLTTVKYELQQWRVMSIKIWIETILQILNVNLTQKSPTIKTPTVVIYSAQDNYINNSENHKYLTTIFKNLEVVEMPLDRHVPPGRMSFKQAKALCQPIIEQLTP